ncbi:MAG: hypothetical protein A3F17_00700 [Gammaproteobacteria bacterium RIFCSPHIGHO2_12_FULL_41_15]|nr:MAG: hypothetical protein A3F17_00700 [Gammaproteobacteria bacterium RIFCSPHIGHO2_12_FULL_41_15]
MDTEFLPNNLHLKSLAAFKNNDPQLSNLYNQKYTFRSQIIDELPIDVPGIYNVSGGRQIGKTTLLKQWMLHLMTNQIKPEAIAFLSCELIVDEKSLYRIISNQLSDMPEKSTLYLIIDEITYVSHWDKAIKYLADTGALKRVALIISGSDLTLMQEARKRFPGRRGKADKVDFHYHPLSFQQTFALTHKLKGDFSRDKLVTEKEMSLYYKAFYEYMIHGGFLTAINEYAKTQSISIRTLETYSDWIRGDVIKHGKKEHYLRELISAILKHYSSQISWRNLVNALSIDHTQTAIDYINLLESMDAVFIQSALIEDKLVGAPKKHRKFMFNDPFIYHAMQAWLKPTTSPFTTQITPTINDSVTASKLVESIVATHFSRHYPTYYIKAENEVDVAYIKDNQFFPIETKWTHQLRPSDLKQILKYKNGEIWCKLDEKSEIQNIPIWPLPWALLSQDWST